MVECKIILGKNIYSLTKLCKDLGKSQNTVRRVFFDLNLHIKSGQPLVVNKRNFELFCMKLLRQDIKFIQKIVEFYFPDNTQNIDQKIDGCIDQKTDRCIDQKTDISKDVKF